MTVKDLIKKLQKLPHNAEFVAWNDEREIYVGVDAPNVVSLIENKNGELIDASPEPINGYVNIGKVYVTIGLQG